MMGRGHNHPDPRTRIEREAVESLRPGEQGGWDEVGKRSCRERLGTDDL
jgi:hypothetical protein